MLIRKHWAEAILQVVKDLKEILFKESGVAIKAVTATASGDDIHNFNNKPFSNSSSNAPVKPIANASTTSASSDKGTHQAPPQPTLASNSGKKDVPLTKSITTGAISQASSERINHTLFLLQLHDALVVESPEILSFNVNNLQFSIHNIETFTSFILPKYFKGKNCCSLSFFY